VIEVGVLGGMDHAPEFAAGGVPRVVEGGYESVGVGPGFGLWRKIILIAMLNEKLGIAEAGEVVDAPGGIVSALFCPFKAEEANVAR